MERVKSDEFDLLALVAPNLGWLHVGRPITDADCQIDVDRN
jgi:hypothetical protein